MSECRRSTRAQAMTDLSKLIGGASEWIPSEVPTLRDVLRYVLFVHRCKSYQLTINDLISDAATRVILAWNKSNANFTQPVIIMKKAVISRIQTAYKFFSSFAIKWKAEEDGFQ